MYRFRSPTGSRPYSNNILQSYTDFLPGRDRGRTRAPRTPPGSSTALPRTRQAHALTLVAAEPIPTTTT